MGGAAKAVDSTIGGVVGKKLIDKAEEKKEKEEARRRSAAEREAALMEENKGLQKNLDISAREKKKQGIASLVGGDQGSSTLG